jgi:hypothetical protein
MVIANMKENSVSGVFEVLQELLEPHKRLVETGSFTRLGARNYVGDNMDRECPVEGASDVIAGGSPLRWGSPPFVPDPKDTRTNNRITSNI